MFRTLSHFALTLVLALLPGTLFAGGPPWLCLPIDGVTQSNADACGDLLTKKLEDKFATQWEREVELQHHAGQWYLTFYLGSDVSLGEVEKALEGSKFSVPRDRLRLFGHVILEIDAPAASRKALLAAFDALNYVSIEKSADNEKRLVVTADMPYPNWGNERKSVGWKTFHRNDLSSDQTTRSESPATPKTLPSYEAFRDIVARHGASLKDIRWDTNYACRPLGGVAAPDSDTAVSREDVAPVGK